MGLDYLLDDNLNVWLIEVNQNPCIETLCDRQKVLIENLLKDTFAY